LVFYEYDEEDAPHDAVFCVFEGNNEPFVAVSDAFYAIDGLCFWGCEDIVCKIISFLQHFLPHPIIAVLPHPVLPRRGRGFIYESSPPILGETERGLNPPRLFCRIASFCFLPHPILPRRGRGFIYKSSPPIWGRARGG